VGVDENLYRAPEAAVERPVREPRPFRVFLAGAVCIGGSVPFLILTVAGTRIFILDVMEYGWTHVLTNRRELWTSPFVVLCAVCGMSLLVAGRSFLTRQGRRGRRLLLVFAASFLLLVAFIIAIASFGV
jgi:predicted acyltransferase